MACTPPPGKPEHSHALAVDARLLGQVSQGACQVRQGIVHAWRPPLCTASEPARAPHVQLQRCDAAGIEVTAMQGTTRIHTRRAMQDDHSRYRARGLGRQRQHRRNPNRYRLAGGWQWLTIERDEPFADRGNGAAIGGSDLSPSRCELKGTAQHQADGHYFEHLVTPERHERVLNRHPI